MSSASKTLELLKFFSPQRPEIGLSQMCKLARRDKATTYRHLQALEDAGFVEQNPVTKQYRLGPTLLSLARTRELTVPRKAGVEAPLRSLADATGETSHVCVLSGKTLYNLSTCESAQHSIRVVIDIETFPLHATSSGLTALAFGPDDLQTGAKLKRYTQNTITDTTALDRAIQTTRASGFGKSKGTYETDVHSLAAPLFDQTGQLAGTVATASVATRLTPALEQIIKAHLVAASRAITHNWGGTIPAQVEQAWAASLSHTQELETTS
ncbi:IclR family transcriptional regulator [Planktotalea sp.]|uniref:IclR family transcriptional regulator n=1 Tax=Planktotalea sp. TaxID=2029877 RepID=UPI003C722ABF